MVRAPSRGWRTGKAAAAAALAWLSSTGAAAPGYPPRTILLLVADWCAPCRGEIAQLDALAAAAQPYAVRVFLADDNRGGRRMMRAIAPADRWEPDEAETMRAALLARTPGLPLSVAIGSDGRPCGEWRGGLTPMRARALVQGCPP